MSSIATDLQHKPPGAIRTRVAQLLLYVTVASLGGCAASRVGVRGPVRVAAVGDLQLDAATPEAVRPLLAALLPPGLRLVNLEGPLTARGLTSGLDAEGRPVAGVPLRFAGPPARARLLAGVVDVAGLANNHALDQGAAGRDDTVRALAAVGVDGLPDGAVLERGGVRVVGLWAGPTLDEERALATVRAAAARGPTVVFVHWHGAHPRRGAALLPDDEQRALAARLVDAGAAAVIGHGPHAPQGLERRGRAVVAYSLGNVAFSCRCTDETDAYALTLTLTPDGVATDVALRPFTAGVAGQPPSLDADPGAYELLTTLARDLGTTLVRRGALLVESPPR